MLGLSAAILVIALILVSFSLQGAETKCKINSVKAVDDGNEPPKNPYLADSPWPMTHRNSYCQASTPYPGPVAIPKDAKVNYTIGTPGLITIAISSPYPDNSRVIWGSTLTYVFKANSSREGIRYIDKIGKGSLNTQIIIKQGLSGAYTILDENGIFYVPCGSKIFAYGDKIHSKPKSPIEIKRIYEIPEKQLEGPNDWIVGTNLIYDGMIAFATSRGTGGVISRKFDEAYFLKLGENEEISNSIACDEKGGIYVVTSRHMYRVQWTGERLTYENYGGWIADYDFDDGSESGISLGHGSGCTPTLMGVGNQDKFVVITDGQKLMHLVLFWRDGSPENWERIPGTKDRRIAGQVPVTFGNPDATETSSEQSVRVRGYGVLVVNNQLKDKSKSRVLNLINSNNPDIAPYGIEKFEWNPQERRLKSVWANREISMPNGIPTMSAATNYIYNVGQCSGVWTIEAVDWDNGETVFSHRLGQEEWYNSSYAGTEVGIDGSLYSGTMFGMIRMGPCKAGKD